MKNYIKLARPKHYIKNLLIYMPLFFSGNLFNFKLIFKLFFGFLSFSVAASVVYVINDIFDKEKDKKHPIKKKRPIASGDISIKNAIIFAILLFCSSYLFGTIATNKLFDKSYIFIIIYVFLNLLYSFKFKNIPLLDITILSSGFLIRIIYGAIISNILVSNWLYLTIIAVSFYLVLGKRRNEIKKSGIKSREVLKYYTEEFLDKNMYMCLAITIVFYALWTVEPSNVLKTSNALVWTVPIVILILMKYSMNVEKDGFGDPVDVVLDDKVLFLIIALYFLFLFFIIYI